MNFNLKNAVIRGTIILTFAGILTKLIGFFYRIYLTRTIGAIGMGLMQLTMPVAGIAFAICSAGIQTAISKFCSAQAVKKDSKDTVKWLIYGIIIALPISFILTFLTYNYSDFIAARLLLNAQCSPLIKILSFTFPFSCFHNCVCGYYYGYKKTAIPAVSQLLEQLTRVITVYVYSEICIKNNLPVTVIAALWGSLISEIIAAAFCFIALCLNRSFSSLHLHHGSRTTSTTTITNTISDRGKFISEIRKMLVFSIPLTCNRLLMHILQSCESILIPAQLLIYGYSQSESLSIYGILTGMAVPFILFPAAITGSLSVMLLSEVSGAQSANNSRAIKLTIERSIHFCLSLGIFTIFLFLFYVGRIGSIIFNEPSLHMFIITLCWLCPFYYLSMTLSSILNGLGHSTLTCIQNTVSILIRIVFLIVVVPFYGILGYLWGLLVSQIFICILNYISLYKRYKNEPAPFKNIILPTVNSIFCIGVSLIINKLLVQYVNELIRLCIDTFSAGIIFIVITGLIHYYNSSLHRQQCRKIS